MDPDPNLTRQGSAILMLHIMPHLWEEELGVELVDGLDVGEDGGHRLGGEQSTRSILLVHAEVKNLEKKK